ncbi:MAG: TolC family protein [Spirochaetaceae bacterium]|nr:MAG: TolC family protein [Spirochaetaceae bacterium]
MHSSDVCVQFLAKLFTVLVLLLPGTAVVLFADEAPDVVSISSVDDAFRLALAHDITHDHRQVELELARSGLARLNRMRLPSLTTTVASSRDRIVHSADTQAVQLQAGLAYSIYDGGMRDFSRRTAVAELAMAQALQRDYEAGLRTVVQELLAAVEFATHAALIAGQHTQRVDRELESLARDHELGLLTAYEMQRTQLSAARTALESQQRQARVDDLHTELRQILGLGNDTVLSVPSVTGGLSLPRRLRNDVSILTEHALREDPALQQLWVQVETARAALDFLPSVSVPVIQSTLGVSMRGTPLPLASPEVSLGVRFSWPGVNTGSLSFGGVFSADSGRYTARSVGLETGAWTRYESRNDAIRRRMNAERAGFAYTTGRQQTEAWIRQTVRDHAYLRSALETDEEGVRLAELALVRIRADVAAGHRRGTAILDAERELAEARLNALESSFALILLHQRLQQRTGLSQP